VLLNLSTDISLNKDEYQQVSKPKLKATWNARENEEMSPHHHLLG
jgi:hypothetical protein